MKRSLSLVAAFLPPFPAALLPMFACPFSISASALPLGLLYFVSTEAYICLDTHQKVWFYLPCGSSPKIRERVILGAGNIA